MTESEQLALITKWAQQHRVLMHHCRDSRGCTGSPGLPDVILVGPGGLLFAELKTSNGGLRPGQTDWRWMLRAAGGQTVLWLPSHFRDGTVEAAIARLGVLGQQ
jgi:hypothetical protein